MVRKCLRIAKVPSAITAVVAILMDIFPVLVHRVWFLEQAVTLSAFQARSARHIGFESDEVVFLLHICADNLGRKFL